MSVNLPPIYVASGDAIKGKKNTDFAAALADPNVTGPVLPWAWDGGTLFNDMLAASGDMPFILSQRPWPVPSDGSVPTFQLDGRTVAAYWQPAYLTAWEAYSTAMMAAIAPVQNRLAGMRFCFVTPYGDNEDGLFASDPASGDTRYDALFAAQGYTPVGAIAAHTSAFLWMASQPEIADISISLALLTPGNQPRVNNAGQVTPSGNDQEAPNGIVAAFVSAFPDNAIGMAYDVYEGQALPDWWQAAVTQTGNLVMQMHGTAAITKEVFLAAFKAAVALNPLWIEVHTYQVQYLADAIAGLSN
jgi:hypothetical protein